MQRALGFPVRQMDDLDRSLQNDARRDIEHKPIGKKSCVERREWLVQRLRFQPRTHQIRPLGNRRRHRPEPHSRRKMIQP